MTAKATDNVRGAEIEAEPVYSARVGRPLTAEVGALCFVDEDATTKLELLCGNTLAVVIVLDELPVDATSDTACELE